MTTQERIDLKIEEIFYAIKRIEETSNTLYRHGFALITNNRKDGNITDEKEVVRTMQEELSKHNTRLGNLIHQLSDLEMIKDSENGEN